MCADFSPVRSVDHLTMTTVPMFLAVEADCVNLQLTVAPLHQL